MSRFTKAMVVSLAAVLALAACSQSGQQQGQATSAQAQSQAQANPKAQQDLKMYQDLRKQGSYDLAGPIGASVVRNYPGTPEAAQVRKTLADTQARAGKINEKRRLAQLWLYQSGEESGGRQNTATIYGQVHGPQTDRIRLVLRRHSDWGQSAYLYSSGPHFQCGSPCRIQATFDGGKPQQLVASLPDSGEPAMFIEHDKDFIARMEKARTITMQVKLKGRGERSVEFEVGGFDPAKWPKP